MSEIDEQQQATSRIPWPRDRNQRKQANRVSLGTFITFIGCRTTSQQWKVARMAVQELETPYDVKKDFYKQIREALVLSGGQPVRMEDVNVRDTKSRHAKERITGWAKYVRAYNFERADRKRRDWVSDSGLIVKVNPDLALRSADELFYIRLHLRDEGLNPDQRALAYQLMHDQLVSEPNENVHILNVRTGTVYKAPNALPDPDLRLKLEVEAQALKSYMNSYRVRGRR